MNIISALNNFNFQKVSLNKQTNRQIPHFKGYLPYDTFEFSRRMKNEETITRRNASNPISSEINDKMIQLDFSNEDISKYIQLRKDQRFIKLSDSTILQIVAEKFTLEQIKEFYYLQKDYDLNVEETRTYFDTREKYGATKNEALCFIYNNYTKEEIDEFEGIYKDIPQLYEPLQKLGMMCPDYIVNGMISNRITDVQDFKSYIESIDMEAIDKIFPRIRSYSNRNLSTLLSTHYKLGTKEFTKDTLSLNGRLTDIVTNRYVNASDINNILVAFPFTSRNIGTLPDGWLNKIPDTKKTETTEEVFDICAKFAKDSDDESFKEALSNALKQDVKIKYCGSGDFGGVYRISIQDCIDTCIKIFHEQDDTYCENKFGQYIEPQISLFANNYSDDFVKAYFGRVSRKNDKDPFMVCQFLSKDITPEETGKHKTSEYALGSGDCHEANIINNRIIDFGAVKIFKNGIKFHKWFE